MSVENQLICDVKGKTGIIRVRGDVSGESAVLFDEIHGSLMSGGMERIVYDFSGMTYINSAGLAIILDFVSSEDTDLPEFRAFGMNDHFARIMKMVDMQHYVRLCADEKDALGG